LLGPRNLKKQDSSKATLHSPRGEKDTSTTPPSSIPTPTSTPLERKEDGSGKTRGKFSVDLGSVADLGKSPVIQFSSRGEKKSDRTEKRFFNIHALALLFPIVIELLGTPSLEVIIMLPSLLS
jgi:hypothetical protein